MILLLACIGEFGDPLLDSKQQRFMIAVDEEDSEELRPQSAPEHHPEECRGHLCPREGRHDQQACRDRFPGRGIDLSIHVITR